MNLLPKTEKEILKKGLRLRFVVAGLYLLSFSFLLGFVTLLPSYFLMRGSLFISENKNSTKNLDENLTKEILDLPDKTNSRLKFLQSNLASLSATDILSKIVNQLSKKIKIDSISFSKNKEYKEKTGTYILISGVASDRDSLVSFSKQLKESNFFSSVDIPVSSLTKEINLPFLVNLFIENKK